MSYHALSNIIQLRKQLAKYMSDVGFRSTLLGTKSSERDDIHLVRAVIAAGLYPNIIIAPETLSGKVAGEVVFRGREINDIYLHPSATSYTAKVLDSRYGCYHEIMKICASPLWWRPEGLPNTQCGGSGRLAQISGRRKAGDSREIPKEQPRNLTSHENYEPSN